MRGEDIGLAWLLVSLLVVQRELREEVTFLLSPGGQFHPPAVQRILHVLALVHGFGVNRIPGAHEHVPDPVRQVHYSISISASAWASVILISPQHQCPGG